MPEPSPDQRQVNRARVAAFLATGALCAFPNAIMRDPVPLLAERFLAGTGWLEVIALATYAGWIAGLLVATPRTAAIRMRLWLLFSVAFFAQLFLGLAGVERLLMTGTLHVPVPAVIVAGPVFRGEGFFMPVLLGATILIGGPMWCSWLCYVGAWDNFASRARLPGPATKHREWIRIAILTATVAVALILRETGASSWMAAGVALAFGAGGVAVMATVSRQRGTMMHCTAYCPIGLIVNLAGRLNPFRMRIAPDCTGCQACARACRYQALRPEDISARTVGMTCTLCGDCTSTCHGGFISYRFPGLLPAAARATFLTMAAVAHTVCLGFGRL